MKETVNVAVVGATGVVGRTILQVLEERDFPVGELYLMASKRSAGKVMTFKGREYEVEELTERSFDKPIDIALFSAGGSTSEEYAAIANEKGATVIDNSSQFRMDQQVPLIVPEVNPQSLRDAVLIANPNCSTIQSVVVLKPLYEAFGIKRIVYNTYQAVSGSGAAGVRDLDEDETKKYPYAIRRNVLPHIDVFLENGYTKEEQKMIDETHKILEDDRIKITATAVRVPIRNSHAVSINIEFDRAFDLEEVYTALREAPGIVIEDDPENNVYPIPEQADGQDNVLVGRIRRDFSVENGINLWCVADNIRKGAATNTVQIAELLVGKE